MEKKPQTEHKLVLENRAEMSLTGVLEVVSFTENEISLKTVCGDMLIRGDGLNIGKLNTDTGELAVCGTVASIKYNKPKGGLFEGLFK